MGRSWPPPTSWNGNTAWQLSASEQLQGRQILDQRHRRRPAVVEGDGEALQVVAAQHRSDGKSVARADAGERRGVQAHVVELHALDGVFAVCPAPVERPRRHPQELQVSGGRRKLAGAVVVGGDRRGGVDERHALDAVVHRRRRGDGAAVARQQDGLRQRGRCFVGAAAGQRDCDQRQPVATPSQAYPLCCRRWRLRTSTSCASRARRTTSR